MSSARRPAKLADAQAAGIDRFQNRRMSRRTPRLKPDDPHFFSVSAFQATATGANGQRFHLLLVKNFGNPFLQFRQPTGFLMRRFRRAGRVGSEIYKMSAARKNEAVSRRGSDCFVLETARSRESRRR